MIFFDFGNIIILREKLPLINMKANDFPGFPI